MTSDRAQCSRCEGTLLVTDGVIEKHTDPDPFARGACPGSNRPPRRAATDRYAGEKTGDQA